MKRGPGLLALVSLFLSASATAQAPLPVHVGGRAVPEANGAWRFGWPGVYFESRFSGTSVTVAVESASEHFRVLVDGAERAILTAPGRVRLVIDGLPRGPHVVRLEKQTESQEGSARFLGFRPGAGATALPPVARARRIEFIGDSNTVGYGNASHDRTCSREEVHDRTDTSRAFGPLVAARLDADYRINAFSGHGVVRNYNGSSPDSSRPLIYARMSPGDPAPLESADGEWRPQLIVIALGANDFSTPLHAGERWPNDAALRADYRDRYVAFVRMLRARQPQARFLLVAHESFAPEMEQVAAALNGDHRGSVATLRYGALERTGCDWHPRLADHRLLADLVLAAIGRIERLWN